MKKDINKMTRKDFESIPYRDNWSSNEGLFDSIVILPAKVKRIDIIKHNIKKKIATIAKLNQPEIWEIQGLHDSGYRQMDFIGIRDGRAICRLSGCSDVLHFDGIGGTGGSLTRGLKIQHNKDTPRWSIDILPTSGLTRIFDGSSKLHAGASLSSFELTRV
jgi:hypothetical protein